MKFTRRRGRPKKLLKTGRDRGTLELQAKRRLNLTTEPLDLCLIKGLINSDQYSSGLYFRWLYTLKFGNPTIRSYLPDICDSYTSKKREQAWLAEQQEQYRTIIKELRKENCFRDTFNICIMSHLSDFLIQSVTSNNRNAFKSYNEFKLFISGLDIISEFRRRG